MIGHKGVGISLNVGSCSVQEVPPEASDMTSIVQWGSSSPWGEARPDSFVHSSRALAGVVWITSLDGFATSRMPQREAALENAATSHTACASDVSMVCGADSRTVAQPTRFKEKRAARVHRRR